MTTMTANRVLRRIYRKQRGWAFSAIDFASLGTRTALDVTLHRLVKRGTIRRISRGVYEYPRYSERLKTVMAPEMDQVANAIARKFGWRIQPSGAMALNLIGLSTQVPSQYVYLSDGPNRTVRIAGRLLEFRHSVLKESSFKLRESSLVVQALRSLGRDRITPRVIAVIRRWLDPEKRARVLEDTHAVTGWVYANIRKICN